MPEPGTDKNEKSPNPLSSLEPYAQLIRSLMPRATGVCLFDARGELDWSNESTLGPDLVNLVDDTLMAARSEPAAAGQMRPIEGNVPVYVFWLRDDEGQVMAVLAVLCRRAGGATDAESRSFTFVHSLLRPAIECLRRDFVARKAIDNLNNTVVALDRDLEMLLADPAQGGPGELRSSDELKSLAQKAVEHLKCSMAALLVPQKGVAMLRCRPGAKPDPQLLARTHRQLISMAQMRAEPMIINRVAPSAAVGIIPYRILSCPVRHPSGRTLGVLALFRDHEGPEFVQRDARIGDVIARRAASIVESQYDGLSGLYTRSALEQCARSAIAERGTGAPWSALYIDADQLHVINDNFGMHVGDEVIGQLGELIRSRLPPGGLAARISGDRFAALLPGVTEDAAQVAEGLRSGAELLGAAQPNGRVHVSISIGVAPLETALGELSHALAAAESACKAAKDRGRNRVAVYEADDVNVMRRLGDITLAARLRNAIETQRLRLDAQLIVPFDSAANLVPHYELLLRMIGEDGATLGPDSFLSAANRYHLMPTIDRWVIERTITLLEPNAALLAERPAVFAINLSGQSLTDDSFADFLLRVLEASGLDPALFCFEFTESATIANVERAELLMRRLRRLGCGVSLDDFGTGMSSLSYLRQLPVSMLKIDGSFVRDILKDARAESMVRAIAQLARNMGLVTVAESVETEEIRARIATLSVDYGQGFAIGRPQPFLEVLDQLPMLASASPAYIVEEDQLSDTATTIVREITEGCDSPDQSTVGFSN